MAAAVHHRVPPPLVEPESLGGRGEGGWRLMVAAGRNVEVVLKLLPHEIMITHARSAMV